MLRRRRFGDLIERQLELFERDHADLIRNVREKLDHYNAADRSDAEERYGDYLDAVETGTELLADARDHFMRTLDEATAEQYEREFNRAVAKRLPTFALELENR